MYTQDEQAMLKKYQGSLLGLAVGDALGTTLEFEEPGTFQPISDMIGGGPFDLEPGQWTDDTSMALCLAESLVETRAFDPVDQMDRYLEWAQFGHLSSTGTVFDIGGTVERALDRYEATGDPWAGSTDPRSAGNGSIIRLAPVPLAFAQNPGPGIEQCAKSSQTTHGAATCIDACRYFGGLLIGAVRGFSKEDLLSPGFRPDGRVWAPEELVPEIAAIAFGSFKQKEPPAIKGTGYVVHSLEAALWGFFKSESFKEGALLAVNLGDDADTTGAVYGQLAGAFYGVEAIPEKWRRMIVLSDQITRFAERLFELSKVIRV